MEVIYSQSEKGKERNRKRKGTKPNTSNAVMTSLITDREIVMYYHTVPKNQTTGPQGSSSLAPRPCTDCGILDDDDNDNH